VNAAEGDYRLAAGSQAINRGDNNAAFAAGLTPGSRDLAGNRRFIGASIDIGAYEFQGDATPPVIGGNFVVTTLFDQSFGVPYISDLSLREALLLAKNGTVITFDPALFADGKEKTITLSFGELKITNSVTIVGMTDADDNKLLTIDANGASRVMSVSAKTGSSIDVMLENLILKGGDASKERLSQGGAMHVSNANLTLNNVAFKNNNAAYGGALFMKDSIVTMADVTMKNNTGNWGGAIYTTGTMLEINTSTFEKNTGQRGGAIYQDGDDSNLELKDVKLIENKSTWGGGLYLSAGKTTLTRTTIKDNDARNNFGRAIVKSKNAGLTIDGNIHETAMNLYLDEEDL